MSNDTQTSELPEDLLQLVNSAATIKQMHTLLQTGLFPGVTSPVICDCLSYLTQIHTATMTTIEDHPNYNLLEPSDLGVRNDQ